MKAPYAIRAVGGDSGHVELETPALRLVIEVPNLRLVWYDKNNEQQAFAEDLPRRAYAYGDEQTWHYRRRYADDAYFGLGERTGSLNLAGRRFRLDRLDATGYDAERTDPLYKFCPFYVTLNRTTLAAHGIYYMQMASTQIDLGQEVDAMWGPYTTYQVESSAPLEYIVLYGPSVSAVVKAFVQFTGRPQHLPPRYAFGYLASSMAYADAEDAQAQIEGFAQKCLKFGIPCDGMHLSSGYTVVAGGDRCVFTWNKERFPDPEGMAKRLGERGMKIFANVKPWLLQQSHPDYPTLRDKRGLVWDSERDAPSVVWQWRAGRYTMGEASYIDLTSTEGYAYWQEHISDQLVDKGYELWLDNNEFGMLDDRHTYACQVLPERFAGLVMTTGNETKQHRPGGQVGTPIQTLLMIQASYDVLRQAKPTERPFLISRSSVPYSQQLVTQTWSGDNTTEWKTIGYNVSMGVGAALSAVPFGYGHDVGGFAGPKPDPELLVRWVQQGIFWPRFAIHSYNEDGSVTEPWMYPEVLPTIREAIHLRYKLIPYFYSLHVVLCFRSCEPLIRPVFYDHQTDLETLNQQFDFMLGPSLLVAPVIRPGNTSRDVYLPKKGAEEKGGWYHYQTGQYYTGGQTITVASTTDDPAAPLFVKAGSLICFGKVVNHVLGEPDSDRRVQIFPERNNENATRATLTIIEDDGKTLYHEEGQAFCEVNVWMEAGEKVIRVGLDIINEGYFPDYDTIWVTCPIASETRQLVFVDPAYRILEARECRCFVDDTTLYSYYGIPLPWSKNRAGRHDVNPVTDLGMT
ncbi:glycosyl hydrolases family 31-domain-containing protein [Dichotomocladium elegans]|nr:glycosyl hydrolases family 31-domain-containing protein [Dichotomocladium elegans]